MRESDTQLHPIERSLLVALANNQPMSIKDISNLTGLNIDQVRRGIEWLRYKNLISVKDKTITKISIGEIGLEAIKNRFPERRLVESVKQGLDTMQKLSHSKIFSDHNEIKIAYRYAVHINKWLAQQATSSPNEDLSLAVLPESERPSTEEALLKKVYESSVSTQDQISKLSKEELKALDSLRKRHFVIERRDKDLEINLSNEGRQLLTAQPFNNGNSKQGTPKITVGQPTSQLIVSGNWRNVRFSPLDVEAPTQLVHAGKKHPLQSMIDEITEAFISMGFLEIEGPLIQPSFWNFDALFTPQDHPAREMQDTFYIDIATPATTSTSYDYITKMVSRAHRKGWQYKWDIEEAKRTVLRTHATPVTIKYLSDHKPVDARIFTIGRVFRNEKTSYKHLAEFNQIEGVVTGTNMNLRNLMGLQMEFYSKLGIRKVKFWPTYFPYTEPSLQSMIYNEALDKWVELFGMGIFRPEVTGPLGIVKPVLAWGGGIERLAMIRFGLNDVRDLYSNNLSWLRSAPRFRL